MSTPLVVLGTSHRSAATADREAHALDERGVEQVLREVHAGRPDTGVMVLATCNRTEVYVSGHGAAAALAETPTILGCAPGPHASRGDVPGVAPGWYRHTGASAFRHLARVSCGLESPILGDTHVPAQIREAARRAEFAGALDGALARLVDLVLQVGRHARRATDIATGAPGTAPAVVEAITSRRRFLGHGHPHVLVVGAGDVAAGVVRLLTAAGVATVTVVNRNDRRASELASAHGASYAAWSQLPDALRHADVVVAATSATVPVLDADLLAPAVHGRRRNLLAIDVGFPHNVVAVPGVRVVGLDELDGASDALTSLRRAAIPAAEAIVEDAVQEWVQTARALELEDLIKSLTLDLAFLSQDIAPALAAQRDPDAVQRSFHRAVTRLLHPYVEQLRAVVLAPGTEVLDNPQEVVTG